MQDGRTEESATNHLRDHVSNIFNFRFAVYQGLCPSDDLVLPQKEAILFLVKILSLVHLVLLGITYNIINKYSSQTVEMDKADIEEAAKNAPLAQTDASDTSLNNSEECIEEEEEFTLTFIHRLEMTFMKLVKLFYTPVTKSVLQMIHCVEIMGTYHLFVYGEHICYSTSQIAIIALILPNIFLFPVSFELAIRLLRRKQISPTVFTMALGCPFYGIFLYACAGAECLTKTSRRHTKREKLFMLAVLASEEELFVRDDKSFSWQVS